MNGQKMKGMIGLALRARQAVTGMDACRMLIKSGKCGVLLIDITAGNSTRKKAEELCIRSGIPIIAIPEGMIEEANGKSNMLMGLQKGSFTEEILARETKTDKP